ncbi:transcriptional activator RfaH [Amylibacter sp.]|nr:transcriptional activator RfaH [Amylibacter sp.]
MSKEWFILQFKPNAHHQAVKNLNRQGFETFLPLLDATSRNGSRFINSSRPLFPGYMFVKFDRTDTNWHKINNTFGVSRLITFNSIIKSIPATVINNLTKRCDLSGKLVPLKKLKKGSEVKVLNGPFTNFIATIEKYETNQRIWILMDLMGREAKVQTTLDSLQTSN